MLRAFGDLGYSKGEEEEVVGVASARVVFAEYAQLQKVFPHLAHGKTPMDPVSAARRKTIDQWLLESCAFLSTSQVVDNPVNMAPHTDERRTRAFRPPRYGRALVFQVRDQGKVVGLLDVKGTGVAKSRTPGPGHHFTGLLLLPNCLGEWIRQVLITAVLGYARSLITPIPVYAIIDLGFENRWGARASLLVRQPHYRPEDNVEFPVLGSLHSQLCLHVELLLRRYGITSGRKMYLSRDGDRLTIGRPPDDSFTDEERSELMRWTRIQPGQYRFDGTNIQLAGDLSSDPPRAGLVDFDDFKLCQIPNLPVVNLVRHRLLNWGETIWPGDPRFVVSDPRLFRPLFEWFARYGDRRNFQNGNPRRVGFLFRQMERDLARIISKWPAVLPTES